MQDVCGDIGKAGSNPIVVSIAAGVTLDSDEPRRTSIQQRGSEPARPMTDLNHQLAACARAVPPPSGGWRAM